MRSFVGCSSSWSCPSASPSSSHSAIRVANDSATSRFEKEGYQEPYIAFVKRLTSKPVVGVGRYTSPESMVSAIRRGVLDMIGAARPSIADPFLPRKIESGALDDIRESVAELAYWRSTLFRATDAPGTPSA